MIKSGQKLIAMLAVFLVLLAGSSLINTVQAQDNHFFEKAYGPDYEKDMVTRMNEGINSFLTGYTKKVVGERGKFWNRDVSSAAAYRASVAPNREDLRQMIGAVDKRSDANMTILSKPGQEVQIAETKNCIIYRVRWDVMGGLTSEGLLLMPKGEIKASVVVIPDADESPESYAGLSEGSGLGLRLARRGAQVIIPVLVNRDTRYSGSDGLIPYNMWKSSEDSASEWTNETHREWIHRQGYIMGRHIIGMEVQKILSAVDWLKQDRPEVETGIMGYGEGGLLALYSAALDTRIDVTWVSGYFGPREELWKEPVYRNVWGLLVEFGDAEIASLIALRKLVIEPCPVPEAHEPPRPKKGQQDHGFPGKLETPSFVKVKGEFDRLLQFFEESAEIGPEFFLSPFVDHHGSLAALSTFAGYLKLEAAPEEKTPLKYVRKDSASIDPQRRVFDNMVEYIQDMIPTCSRTRYAFLRGDMSSEQAWDRDMEPYRKLYYEELVGRIDQPLSAMKIRTRQIYDEPGWNGYEVVLDVLPDIFAWGILAVPDDLKPGERRPVVVMQHGIGGVPTTTMKADTYNGVLQALVNRGFVVFSPHNPYQFNVRKANAIKTSVFSVIIPQHKRILEFLQSLDYVDADRIALYGKSWGGRTALRVPIVLKGYSASICSAYFNDWLKKTVSTDYKNSYLYEGSVGIYEWNMGNTFTHAEMAALMAPRPFMVEAGYLDAVAADEMVAYEFSKVKRLYEKLGIGHKAQLELFMGGHEINGAGTFEFLHKYLDWPAPRSPTAAQQLSR